MCLRLPAPMCWNVENVFVATLSVFFSFFHRPLTSVFIMDLLFLVMHVFAFRDFEF